MPRRSARGDVWVHKRGIPIAQTPRNDALTGQDDLAREVAAEDGRQGGPGNAKHRPGAHGAGQGPVKSRLVTGVGIVG